MFTSISMMIDPASPARIAAQVVTGVGFLGAGYLIAMLIPIDDGLIYSGLRTPIDFAFNWFNLIPTIGYLVFSSFWIFGKFSPKWMALHLLYLPVIILWTHLISVDGLAGM